MLYCTLGTIMYRASIPGTGIPEQEQEQVLDLVFDVVLESPTKRDYRRSADSVLATEHGCRIWLKHIPFCACKLALSTYTNIHSTYKMVVFPQTHSDFYVFYPENTFRSKNGICRTTVFCSRQF
jgi:hypothetical protein